MYCAIQFHLSPVMFAPLPQLGVYWQETVGGLEGRPGVSLHEDRVLDTLVLVLIKDPLTIKRMLTRRHPYTRAAILMSEFTS